MSFKPGDKVRFLHEKGEGTVTKVLSAGKVIVELTEGIEIEVFISELVPVKPISLSDISVRHKDPIGKNKPKADAKPHSRDVMVVDLHADKLDENSYSKSNQQKLGMQLDYFQD